MPDQNKIALVCTLEAGSTKSIHQFLSDTFMTSATEAICSMSNVSGSLFFNVNVV